MNEAALAAELGVSRNTFREAARLLGGEGLVRHQMNRGIVVAEITAADVRDIYAAAARSRRLARKPSPRTATRRSTSGWRAWPARSRTRSPRVTPRAYWTATGSSTPPSLPPRAARGWGGSTPSSSRSSGWPLSLAERSSRALGRTADDHRVLLDALRGTRPRPKPRSAPTCTPGPPNYCGSGTCSTSGKRGTQPMPDNTSSAWDLIVAPWHLDEHIPDFPVPVGTVATIGPPMPDGDVPGRVTVLQRAVADAVAGAARPLLLSGDCPAGIAVAAGLQRRYPEIAVVWLDAHGDFNTPAITISGYLGGMALAMLTGHGPELFADPLGLRPVPERNVVLADARDLDPAERDALAASAVRRIPATADACLAALSGLRDLPVYLHVDVDILDSTEVTGLRFPTGPGPGLGDLANCLAAVTAAANVVAACLVCAWLPGQVGGPTAREAIARLAGALGAELTWPPGDMQAVAPA